MYKMEKSEKFINPLRDFCNLKIDTSLRKMSPVNNN